MKIEIKDYIGIFENAASDDYCDRMIENFEKSVDLSSSQVLDGKIQFGNETGRRDKSIFLENNCDLVVETNSFLDQCLDKYMDEYIGLRNESFASTVVKVQRTPPKGGYHVWHAEQSGQSFSYASRMLAWTLYLNDIPEGQGETEFLHQGLRLQPKKGTICLFPAAWTHFHRGNFTTTATKYIATGWYNLL